MSQPPYDPRAVANLLLDLAAREDDPPLTISNLALQKLLYFAHGHFLMRTQKPLVSGAFEAWTYGPVHPAVYQAFKSEGGRPITIRANARDVITGAVAALPDIDDVEVRRVLRNVLRSYGHLSPGRLVDISHAPRGPWATVVNKARTSVALGLRIPDSVTLECFKHHKVTVGPHARSGEPDEDTPLIGDSSRGLRPSRTSAHLSRRCAATTPAAGPGLTIRFGRQLLTSSPPPLPCSAQCRRRRGLRSHDRSKPHHHEAWLRRPLTSKSARCCSWPPESPTGRR